MANVAFAALSGPSTIAKPAAPRPIAAGGRVSLHEVDVTFGAGSRRTRAVGGVSLQIEPGEFVSIIGPSGCGKSTLLNVIAGFTAPSQGRAELDGQPIAGPGPERGVVFQQHSLFPWLTVLGNVEFGLRAQGLSRERWAATRVVHWST